MQYRRVTRIDPDGTYGSQYYFEDLEYLPEGYQLATIGPMEVGDIEELGEHGYFMGIYRHVDHYRNKAAIADSQKS